jgi:hypothetical protein
VTQRPVAEVEIASICQAGGATYVGFTHGDPTKSVPTLIHFTGPNGVRHTVRAGSFCVESVRAALLE